MAREGTWSDVAIPWSHVGSRLSLRGRILMDPGSAVAMRALMRAFRMWAEIDWNLVPRRRLEELLSILLRCCEHVSDELDRRDGL